MKIIMQDEMSECGLACVSMIASHYGAETTLPALRRRYDVDRTGISLYDLECIFSDLNIVACSYELKYDQLCELELPAIVQWNHNHYVVLSKVGRNYIEVYDPAVGRKRYSSELAKTLFSGYAVNIEAVTAVDGCKPKEGKNSILKSAISIKGVKTWLGLFIITSIIAQFFGLLSPKYIALTVDKVLAVNDIGLHYILSLGFLFIFIFDFLSRILSNEIKKQASYAISKRLYVVAYRNLSNQELKYFQSRNISDITKRLSVISEYGKYIIESHITIIINLAFAVVFAVLVALIDIKAFFAMLACATVFFSVRMFYIFELDKLHSEQIAYGNNRNEVIREFFMKIKSDKVSRLENVSIKESVKFNNKYLKSYLSGFNILNNGEAFYYLCNNICTIAITMLFSMNFLEATKESTDLAEAATVGNFFILFFYKDFFFRNIAVSTEAILNIFKNKAEIDVASGILFDKGEKHTTKMSIDTSKVVDSINISNGVLSYSSFGSPVFENLSLVLSNKDKVAIVGKSGSGKTSLLNVLSSLTPLNNGNFLVNGVSLEKFGTIDYRKTIGVYFSDEDVKNKTLLKNITEDENYDEEHLHRVLSQVGLIDEINCMPSGINTLLGQSGVQLSSGQKQRLLIAKELYKRPSVLLLDEPTSHLDTPNSLLVANIIKEFDGICLIVSHDNELLKHIGKVYQFEDIIDA